MIIDELARDAVDAFVYLGAPMIATGATASNTTPAALGQPTR